MFGKIKAGPIGFAWRAFTYKNVEVARVVQRNLPTIVTATRAGGNGIEIPELGITIDPKRNEDVLKALPQLVSLKRKQNASFKLTPEGVLEIQVSGIFIFAETFQDMLFAHEVFDTRVYAMELPRDGIVWDIGANIGTSSLFFAGCCGWDVLAYEPFPLTAESAKRNILRNNLSERIEFTVAGIGGNKRTESLAYHHEWRGGNGFFGNLGEDHVGEGVQVEVQILDAAAELDRLVAKANGRMVIAKIDCEGAEYEILRRLRETSGLDRIDVVAMEVHNIPGEDPDEPKRVLLQSGMVIVRHEQLSPSLQAIYAVRSAAVSA